MVVRLDQALKEMAEQQRRFAESKRSLLAEKTQEVCMSTRRVELIHLFVSLPTWPPAVVDAEIVPALFHRFLDQRNIVLFVWRDAIKTDLSRFCGKALEAYVRKI